MLKLVLKNGFSLWIKWVWNTAKLKRQFPHARFGFMAKVMGNSWLGFQSKVDNHSIIEHTRLGDFSYVGSDARLNFCNIGKFSSIGPGVYAGLGIHPTDTFVSSSNFFYTNSPSSGLPYFEEYKETIIGHDVWIGARAILIDGVKIGDGAVIGAGAVVTKDVPPYAIAVGVPAKVIKYRFNADEINFLLAFKWWNKDKEWIMKNRQLFSDIQKLMQKNKDQVLSPE